MPAADHPIWAIIRQLIPLAVLGFMLWANYDSVDPRDLLTMLAVAASGGAAESAGKLLKPRAAQHEEET